MQDEPNNSRIRVLEAENKKMRMAMEHWDHLERNYRRANDELQQWYTRLTQLNEKTNLALHGGDLAWWEWDYRTGKVQYNENRAKLLGFTPDELPDSYNGITSMIHPDDYQSAMSRLQRHLDGESPNYEAEFRLQTKTGEWRWFYDRGKIVETDILGKPVRLSGVIIDIHERKSIENLLVIARDKAVTDSRAKSNFLASMSHEIYTPLAGVIGMAEILKQSKLTAEQEEYLDVIVSSAGNLMSILNDILEFSKIESGNVELKEKPFSIHQVVEEITTSCLGRAVEKQLRILSFQDPEIPSEVIGDPLRVRQILRILTDNALKYTETGHIGIEVHFLEWDHETVRVRFVVSDTGIGISAEGINTMFGSFTRLDTPQSKKYGGGGLGLAIAKRLIDRMNGRIQVESEPGRGSTFSVEILFDRYKDSEMSDTMKLMLKGMRGLLVDSDHFRRSLLAAYLDCWEAELDRAGSAGEALKMINHQSEINKPYNFIIIEHQMDGTDGLAFASSLRHDQAVQKSILILTADRRFEFANAELHKAGVETVISQPLLLSRLRSRLKSALTLARREERGEGDSDDFTPADAQKRSLRILLAEDNLINQKVALVILEKIGYSADLAENGADAVERAKETNYDLVLMDIQMPVMDGYEATRRIREIEGRHPGRVPAHICAITANRSREDEERCFEAGMNSYITKPFRLEEITRVLSHI